MYLAKFHRNGIIWRVSLFEKDWSDQMMTNQITEIASKNFIFHSSGYRWINKEVCKHLFKQHELEIING